MEVPVTINKYDIMPLIAHHGKTNSKPFMISGTAHVAGSLLYVSFSGVHVGNQKYKGVHKFAKRPEGAKAGVLDFDALAGLRPVAKPKAVK